MKILGVIAARGGSKGIPHKNIKEFGGKPLIAWTIEAALKSESVDQVVVTTDDAHIALIACEYGAQVPFLRPKELAQDNSAVIPSVLHAAEAFPDHDWSLLLQPTSPLRTECDIDGLVEECKEAKAPAAVAVTVSTQPPEWTFTRSNDGFFEVKAEQEVAKQRQEFSPRYTLKAGGMYLADLAWLKCHHTYVTSDTYMYVMPEERSVDIDTAHDWKVAEALLAYELGRSDDRL